MVDYTIIHVTAEDESSNYPIAISETKAHKIMSKTHGGDPTLIGLTKTEISKTRMIYNNGKRTTFNPFDASRDDFIGTLGQLLNGKKCIFYANQVTKGGRLFLGAGLTSGPIPSYNIVPFTEEAVEEIGLGAGITDEKVPAISYTAFKKKCIDMADLPKSCVTSNGQLEMLAKDLGIKNFSVDVSVVDLPPINDGEQHIVNISKLVGQVGHWCLASKLGGTAYYFDSFGVVPPQEVKDALGGHYIGSDPQVQKIESSECGIKCLYVAYCLSNECGFVSILDELKP